MVREQRARKPMPNPMTSETAEAIWNSPRIQEVLAQPVGSPIDLTPEEAQAIIQHHVDNPRPVDEKALAKAHRELRKIRKMWGTFARFPDD